MTVDRPESQGLVNRTVVPWWAWVLIGLSAANLVAGLYVLTFVINLQLALDDIARTAEEGGFFRAMEGLEQWLGKLGIRGG